MKTRIIKTKFWTDSLVSELSPESKFLFIYLLTSSFIGLAGIFECPDRQILSQTGMSTKKLEKSKQELSRYKRAYFYEQWVWLVNVERHNQYRKSPANEKAYQYELLQVPERVMSFFKTSGYSSPPSTYKPKTINAKSETLREGVDFK